MIETLEHNATAAHDTSDVSAKPRLLDRVREAVRVRHYSIRTERTYIGWIRQYIRHNGMRHPADLGAPEVEAFLSMLANQRDVAASTQNQDGIPSAPRVPEGTQQILKARSIIVLPGFDRVGEFSGYDQPTVFRQIE